MSPADKKNLSIADIMSAVGVHKLCITAVWLLRHLSRKRKIRLQNPTVSEFRKQLATLTQRVTTRKHSCRKTEVAFILSVVPWAHENGRFYHLSLMLTLLDSISFILNLFSGETKWIAVGNFYS